MTVFIGTLLIIVLCCLLMGLGLLLEGKPLSGGCSKAPGVPQCETCPKRKARQVAKEGIEGENGC
jgi:hypothetical protein